ncbi:MAG: hypothetical protein A2286_14110 [Gammaproteobacteria bacterium RIFOXYA12_FULL_61_12]|nr:MAG: hypothetical protein A2286_14110 [Gammaproteobacteria bacterium RIFOXYA12_FULL_61_12]
MHIERSDDMLHPRLGNNGVELFCYLSNCVDDTLDAAIWLHGMPAYDTRLTKHERKPLDSSTG